MTEECHFDGIDCDECYLEGCPTSFLADGECDSECNNPTCRFDEGDCDSWCSDLCSPEMIDN